MYLSIYCKGSRRVIQGLRVRGSWWPTETAIFWHPLLWPSTLCLSRSPELLKRRPRGPLCWVMAFFTASYQHLLWTPIQSGAPSPFGLVWLSLPHLVYNSVRSLTVTVWLLSWLSYIIVQGPLSRLLSLWNRLFDHHQAEIIVMQFTGHSLLVHQSMSVRSLTVTVWLLSWLSYIIVQGPLSRLLSLWNRMFDHHQAEIIVMQFTGHSLLVHQSMSVLWEFFTSSHFISQFPPTWFPLITAIRMCHLLPVHHLGMAFLAGSKVKIQQ